MQEESRVNTTAIVPRWRVWLRRHRWTLLLVVAVLGLAVSAVFLTRQLLEQAVVDRPGEDPVTTVRRFMEATTSLDEGRMLSYIAPEGRPEELYAEVQMALGQIKRLEYREPHLELLNNDGQTAHVYLAATVSYELVQGDVAEMPVRLTFTLIQSQGHWYILEVRPA